MSEYRFIDKFSLTLAYRLKNPPANGKQGLFPAEMSRTLLTNKKQGKNYQVHATHIINTTLFRIYQKKYIYFNRKSVEILKPVPDSQLGLSLSLHVNKGPVLLSWGECIIQLYAQKHVQLSVSPQLIFYVSLAG